MNATRRNSPTKPLATSLALLMAAIGGTLLLAGAAAARREPLSRNEMRVKPTTDFQVTGKGDAAAWTAAQWTPLNKRPGPGPAHSTGAKMLYSATGLYFLIDGDQPRGFPRSVEGRRLRSVLVAG
jgi:hypothetical protein